jgi:hypothetical protein
MTDEHSVPDRPDSDLAKGKRARRALPQLRLERQPLLFLLCAAIVLLVILFVWFR